MADKKKKNKSYTSRIPDEMITPIGVTYGQVRDAYKDVKRYISGKDPESAPAPAKQHKEKAETLSEKSGRAVKKATNGNKSNY